MHATSLVEQSFSELAAVVFASPELLGKVEVFDLAFRFLSHIAQGSLQILGIFKRSVSLIHNNDRFSIQLHKVFIV